MSEYRFEKIQVPVELTLTQGEPVAGGVFVAGSALEHDGPERVADLLNGQPGFLPVRRSDGSTALYNHRHIILVRLGENVREVEAEPGYDVAPKRRVRMLLSNGERIAGLVPVYAPPGRDRISDYARSPEAFRSLVLPDRTLLVNAAHIVELTEIEE